MELTAVEKKILQQCVDAGEGHSSRWRFAQSGDEKECCARLARRGLLIPLGGSANYRISLFGREALEAADE